MNVGSLKLIWKPGITATVAADSYFPATTERPGIGPGSILEVVGDDEKTLIMVIEFQGMPNTFYLLNLHTGSIISAIATLDLANKTLVHAVLMKDGFAEPGSEIELKAHKRG